MKNLAILVLMLLPLASAKAQFSDAPVTESDVQVGIFIVSPDGETTRITPIKYYKTKAGTKAFASAITYGAVKMKNKNTYKGSTSPNVFAEGSKFRFCFGKVPTSYVMQLYMFDAKYSIRNFSLCEFKVKKGDRELDTATFSIWSGFSTGASESSSLDFDVQVVEPNVYECTVKGELKAGEYGFLFTDNGVGAYQSMFDFSVK